MGIAEQLAEQAQLAKEKIGGLNSNIQQLPKSVSEEIIIELSSISDTDMITMNSLPEFIEANNLYNQHFQLFLLINGEYSSVNKYDFNFIMNKKKAKDKYEGRSINELAYKSYESLTDDSFLYPEAKAYFIFLTYLYSTMAEKHKLFK